MLKASFNYIDSSQQQENSDPNYYLKPSPRANLDPQHRRNVNRKKSPFKKHTHGTKSKKILSHNDPFRQNPFCDSIQAQQKVLTDDFQTNVKEILGRKIEKQFVNLLLVNANEKEIQENLKKRNQKYKQFIRDMEIDKKYQQILEQQVFKCHIQNERKKDVLKRHREIEKMKTQQQLLTKYTLQKDQYQTQVVQKLKKKVRKIGVERVQSAYKNVKTQLLQKRVGNKNKLQSKANQQYNNLLELKDELQSIKKAKHVNKLDQDKVLRELQKQVIQKKRDLQGKLKKKTDFII